MKEILYLISNSEKDLQFIDEICQYTGLELKRLNQLDELLCLAELKDNYQIFVDIDFLSYFEGLTQVYLDLKKKYNYLLDSNSIHLMTSKEIGDLGFAMNAPFMGNLIFRNSLDFPGNGKKYGRILKSWMKGRSFGLDSIIKPGETIRSFKLAYVSQKQALLEALKTYLVSEGFQVRMAGVVTSALDELIMNAIYDAASKSNGEYLESELAGKLLKPLEDKSTVEIHVHYDGEMLSVMVTDFYGSLDKLKLLNKILSSHFQKELKIRPNQGGAGIGISSILKMGGNLLFACESGKKTEATIFFRKTESFKEFKEQRFFISTRFYE